MGLPRSQTSKFIFPYEYHDNKFVLHAEYLLSVN